MKKTRCIFLTIAWFCCCTPKTEQLTERQTFSNSESEKYSADIARAQVLIDALQPLQKRLPQDRIPARERGQTFREWLVRKNSQVNDVRRYLVIAEIGSFTPEESELVDKTAEFISRFTGLPLKRIPPLDLPTGDYAYRINPREKHRQARSPVLLDDVLKPALPADGAIIMGFTTLDLYDAINPNTNHIIGESSIHVRTSIVSLYRLGNNKKTLPLLLRTATHEVCHAFTIRHCIDYECLMNSAGPLAQIERLPLHLCSECEAKVYIASRYLLNGHFESLASLLRSYQLPNDAKYFDRAARAVIGIRN